MNFTNCYANMFHKEILAEHYLRQLLLTHDLHCFFRRLWSPPPNFTQHPPLQNPVPQSSHQEGGPNPWPNYWRRRPLGSRGAMRRPRPRLTVFWHCLKEWWRNFKLLMIVVICSCCYLFILAIYFHLFLVICYC